jgi:hypothetical protein
VRSLSPMTRLSAGTNLVVSGSRGQGVIVTNNSHATLAGSSITGGSHGGVVVADLSTIDLQPSSSLTLVGGNAPDLFCDSNSFITGTANLAGVPTLNCGNLVSGNTVPLPWGRASFWRCSKIRMKVTFIPAFRRLERRGGPIGWVSLVASCPSVAAARHCVSSTCPHR